MDSKLLYRFLTEEAAIKTIESWSFKVGRVLDFNDPFEWRFGLNNIRKDSEEHAEIFVQLACKKLHELFGVICFSGTLKDPVLWSHYADRHRGIVIEVDHYIDPQRIIEVKYTNERPTLDASQLGNPDYFPSVWREKITQLIGRKSPGWSYEQEWRSIIELKQCEARNGFYFTPIPPDFVKRIILGSESKLGLGYIQQVLEQRRVKNVSVTKARKSIDTFEILAQ